jgi:hypothetical protein
MSLFGECQNQRDLIAISDDRPGGLEWSTIKETKSYFRRDEEGKSSAVIGKMDWATSKLDSLLSDIASLLPLC